MKGDFYIDFAVATVLFVMAFTFFFYYYNSEFELKIQNEKTQNLDLKIQNILNSLQKQKVEKRIIIVEGYSTNEFVNLSNYDIDLILNKENNRICFDPNIKGFLTNVSGKEEFYLYSAEDDIEKYTCNIGIYNNSLSEKISSPIYEEYIMEIVTHEGDFCEQKNILTFSDFGPKQEIIKICV